MREVDKISEDLFDKIRSRFENVSVGDDKAQATSDPAKARFFNFDYVSKDGENFGNITVSLVDENSIKVYFSKNITAELDEVQKDEWFDFLRGMKEFAKRNLLTFDTRDINRSNLEIRDLQHLSKADSTLGKHDVNMNESRMFGSSRSSYQAVGPVRLIVRHSNNVDESVRGARTRNIEAIFVETHLGERFLMPFKKLTPARAMAQHISNGGGMGDELGQTITTMVKEMADLSVFVRSMRNRTFEDAETTGMVEASIERYHDLHRQLNHMSGPRGYKQFAENFKPDTTILEDEYDMDALRERFVKKIFDDRLSEALPHVYRAYRNKQMALENNYMAEFENWTKQLAEGTWATPDQDHEQDELRKLMEKPLRAGINGEDASNALYNIIGSDSLFDEIYQASKADEGPETDVRPLVIEWLRSHGYTELSEEFKQKLEQEMQPTDQTQPNPAQLTPQANQAAPVSPAPVNQQPTGVQPATESVDRLKRLAGLR